MKQMAIIAGVLVLVTAAAIYHQYHRGSALKGSPFTYGKLPEVLAGAQTTASGILVDAGCRDRSRSNLLSPPIAVTQEAPTEPPREEASQNAARAGVGFATGKAEPRAPGTSAWGITVDPQTLEREQSDVLMHQMRDLFGRQPDMSCGITGDTKAFAFLTDSGRLLDLDEGGNTRVWQAVQSTDAGRRVINGTGPPIKPRVTITGRIFGDKLVVESFAGEGVEGSL
jgi:hypothetical protein